MFRFRSQSIPNRLGAARPPSIAGLLLGVPVSDVVRLRTFPEAEFRAWLQALQSPESYDDPILEYEGITLRNVLDGKSQVAIPAVKPAAPMAAPATMPPSTPGHRLDQRDRAPAVEYALIAPPRRRGAGRIVLAATLGLAALGLAVIGLTVNTRFAASFGQTAEAALLLASLGLAIDLLAIVLPGAAGAESVKLRQPLGAARRRAPVDPGPRNAEARLAALPAITTGDPQAAMAADILAWASAGYVSLTPHDIHRLRITGLTIIPALAGIIFMFAVMLLRVGKKRGKPVAVA